MKNWEKELEKRYGYKIDMPIYLKSPLNVLLEDFKKFISALLLSQRKEVIEEVIKEIKFEYGDYAKIDDLITRLNKLK